LGPTGFGVDARGACTPWLGLCVCLLADWVGRRFLPGLRCPWLALLWPVPAHTRAGPWWLAFGSWVFLGALTRAFLHDCCHSGSSRFLSLHYLLLFRPIPLLSIAGYWIAFEGCLEHHLEVVGSKAEAEDLVIYGAVTMPASCALTEAWIALATQHGLRANPDQDPSRSGSLLGLPTVAPLVTKGTARIWDLVTGSALSAGGITLRPQRLR